MFGRVLTAVRRWLAGEEMRGGQDPERPEPDAVMENGPGPASEGSPTDVAAASVTPFAADRRDLISQARRQGIDDAIRHEEDLLDQEVLPILAETEAGCRGRLDEVRVEWSERRRQLTDDVGAAGRAVEQADQTLRAIEASMLIEGVPAQTLALPPRRGLPVLLRHALVALGSGALVATVAYGFDLEADAVLATAAVAVAVVALLAAGIDHGEPGRIVALRRRRSRAAQALHRARETEAALACELEQLPTLIRARAQAELDLPAEQLAAYESGVLSALPPGALGAERHLPPQRLTPIAMPDWVPLDPDLADPDPDQRTPADDDHEVAA